MLELAVCEAVVVALFDEPNPSLGNPWRLDKSLKHSDRVSMAGVRDVIAKDGIAGIVEDCHRGMSGAYGKVRELTGCYKIQMGALGV